MSYNIKIIMRIDKFLKVSRVIKRRTVANDACDNDHVSVNGKVVKPSYDIKENDIIEISFGAKKTRVQVTKVCEFIKANEAETMYTIIE